ncbi:3297_t:CDS:2 [Dentiscutata erythropus]|uniref:Dihydrofolate reductase n=1 Tax=Dentiscutata erythropus TaxID=1348616 RepID=A0A9N9HXB6_9GLOM|nr:3297_t:CDS:2 [Dentiscutata erythropus]
MNNELPWDIKEELSYFERVTKKVSVSDEITDTSPATSCKRIQNALIMGRKTWETIPPELRPFKDRLNVVLSKTLKPESDMCVIYSSLDEAVANLVDKPTISRIFIIGGGYVYKEAMESPLCEYILITKVYKSFNCDTFFLKIDENLYELASHDELVNFVGDDVPKGRQVDGDIEYEFLMYKRNKDEGDDGSKKSHRHISLQQQDIIYRANEYKDLISTIKLDSNISKD